MTTRTPPRVEFGSAFDGRRVLVTGATGFIGWHLCRELAALGANVHALSRNASAETVPGGCDSVAADLGDLDDVRHAMAAAKPDIVLHLASVVDGRQDRGLVMPMIGANLMGSVHVALACSEFGCRHVVAVGSSDEPTGELDPVASPYAASKAAASTYFRMFHQVYGLPVVMVRPFLTYGPRQSSAKMIPYAISMLLQGRPPKVASGGRVCDFIYVNDVVRGLCRAALANDQCGRTFDLGSGIGTPVRDVVDLLAELCGSSAQPEFEAQPSRVGESSRVADVATAETALGWAPQWSLRDGLAETVAAYRQSDGAAAQ